MKSLGMKALAVSGLCILAVGFNGCQKGGKSHVSTDLSNSADTATVKVVVADVKECAFEDWGSYSAGLRGVEDVNLAAPNQGGRVIMVKEVGSHVKAGEALCDIDGNKYDAALQAAIAQVEVAKGNLERAKINVEKGSLGRSAVDEANLAYQNARMLKETAEHAYEDCRCQAPFDGILVSRSIDKFQTVGPGIPTVRVSRVDRLEAVISIPETEAFSYTEGMKTEFRLLQDPGHVYEGTLKSLDRAVDSHSHTATARIIIVNNDGSLKPGMVGRARILRHSYSKAVVIPSTALVRLQDGISAMVVENGIARQRIVKVGALSEDSTLITDGLHSGDKLIISGAFQVSDGTKVTY